MAHIAPSLVFKHSPIRASPSRIYRRFSVTDLGTLGGSLTVTYAINDAGDVVGISMVKQVISTDSTGLRGT